MRIIRGNEIPFIPASHEDQDRPGVLKRVLAKREELIDGRVQMINWARLPAGSSFRAHYHEDMEETFIILSGHVEVNVNGQAHDLTSGSLEPDLLRLDLDSGDVESRSGCPVYLGTNAHGLSVNQGTTIYMRAR